MTMPSTTIDWLRWVGIAEAISWMALLTAMVAKYGFDQPAGVSAIGPIHGILFLTYAGLVLLARDELRWSWFQTLIALVAAVIPLGTLAVERRMVPG